MKYSVYNRTPVKVLTGINPELGNNVEKDLAKDNAPVTKDRVNVRP